MNALKTAIYTKLQGTSAITSLLAGTTSIYDKQAPDGASYPYLVFSHQAGGDTNDTANRVKSLVYFVRCYSKASASQAGSIDAQIDTALHLVPLTVSGWTDIWLARETDLDNVETDSAGTKVWMQGGLYRLILDKE